MDTMLSKALREFITGPLNQLIVNLGGRDSSLWAEELKKFLRKEPCWTNLPLLEFVSMIGVNATTDKFLANDKFVINTEDNAPVKISGFGDNFTRLFLLGDGKKEDSVSEQTIDCYKLLKRSEDGPIITELGGETKVESSLSDMWFLMEKQKNGEDGALLNNGLANIFYIRDVHGVLRAINVLWLHGGWFVGALDVDRRGVTWESGVQVFSRGPIEILEPLLVA